MKRIETGVDRLVRLISQKKKVTVDQAAKELGVSKVVVTEWAEFLADEGLVSMDYSLSKTYLKEKELSQADVEKKAKQLSGKKESFIRRIDSSAQQLEQQSAGFESIKKEFATLKSQIGDQIVDVRSELDQLKKYENLKSNIDKDIAKETEKYKQQIKEASVELSHEQKKYEALIGDIERERKTLSNEQSHIDNLHAIEKRFIEQQEAIEDLLAKARDEIKKGEKSVLQSEKTIAGLAGRAEKLRDELQHLKETKIDTLDNKREEHEKEIDNLQKSIIDKAKEMKEAISKDVKEGTAAAKRFDTFFKRRVETDKLIKELDKEKEQLEHEMKELRKAALSFKIASKGDNAKHLKELEDAYKKLEKHRETYKGKLQKLVDMIIH